MYVDIISNRYVDDTTPLMAEIEEELKSILMRVKEENEIADLKLNIQKTKIRASSPITSWQIERSFPTTQGMDPSSRARKRKRGSSGCGRDSRASSGVETGISGEGNGSPLQYS